MDYLRMNSFWFLSTQVRTMQAANMTVVVLGGSLVSISSSVHLKRVFSCLQSLLCQILVPTMILPRNEIYRGSRAQ